MAFALELHLDPESDCLLRGVWEALAQAGVSAAAGICLRAPLPLEAQVKQVGLVRVAVEDYEELAVCPWGQGSLPQKDVASAARI